ncbi:DUF3667 domain-containing protein [Brevundimonas sp. NIBR11]|uniref:DUF3667 domain-containing protein n=1 Tax=Brevundimonas sp. NIBR11 TaxID=3015999 RepID=UPI0022F044F7|nr:DUF3667 domain-containing protein [Brevundimonas sp. NIBR11]WGM32148.1 hypothetical protein KKHFBJBL_02399 [Brevundimonas sp. NIBR11]
MGDPMVDVDAAGSLATGGLIAGAIEKPTGHAGADHAGTCSDCGEPTTGNFCANCGQPTHVHRSLLHLGEELLHGVMHFDGRIWRTLPLLIANPGRLTREWVQGKRTRYVSPLAIFLFIVFLMFFALTAFLGGQGDEAAETIDQRIAASQQAVNELRASVTAAEAAAERGDTGEAAALGGLRGGLVGAEAQLRALQEAKTRGPRTDGLTPGSWQSYMADAVHDGNVTIGIGDKKMQEKILHKLANPDFALYKVQQTAYKFAFLLVPLSIPFVWLLFAWKRGFTWYDHGVFVLYSLTFMAMLTMLIAGLARLENGFVNALTSLLCLAVPAHMFAQLKGAYNLSIFSAAWRTLVLMVLCSLVLSLFILAIIVLGLTG